ncbi:prophage tail fiber N-terminal domain-containing protein [Serratia marcescens]|uniref:phage tail fiber protein n=1 Tax=Serratia marcescens TaxID=615 RepID=UPI0037003985
MVLISGVLKGPYGDSRSGVTITMRSMKTSSTVLNLAKSQSVTDDTGRYSLNVEPGSYEVIVSVYGAQPERVGTIEVYTDSLPGTLNDFLRRPGESDVTPEIVQTVDAMRVDAAKSAAAAKVSEENSERNVLPVTSAGFGVGPRSADDIFSPKNISSIGRFTGTTTNAPSTVLGSFVALPMDGGPTCGYIGLTLNRGLYVGRSNSTSNKTIEWKKVFTEEYGPKVTDIPTLKDWGISLGGTAANKGNFNAQMQSRRGYVATDPIGNPFRDTGTYFLDTRSWAVTQTGSDDSYRTVQTCYGYGASGAQVGKIAVRSWNGTTFTPWFWMWSEANTTVDSNGFIKKASPIARLSGTPEAMQDDYLSGGFTPSGFVAVNGEAEGVSAERISVGVYKVTGALGFAEEGWNIEVPQDVNGNRLCFVAANTGKDGTIYVKVSKRRFDIDTAAIVAGEPMDIPAGRWIDLRLEMPVREVEEAPKAVEETASLENVNVDPI